MLEFPKLRKSDIYLSKICIKVNIFFFYGSLYQQVDDVAMENPLGSLLINIFMTYVKDLLFKNNLNEEIGFWARYVNDVIVIFNNIVYCLQGCRNTV